MFSTSTPVIDDAFFDRRDELKRLGEAVAALRQGRPRWLAVLGVRRVGKTSLLLELARRSQRRDLRFVVLDCFEDQPLGFGVFSRLALRSVDAFLAESVGASLEALARRPDEFRAALMESRRFQAFDRSLRADVLSLPTAKADVRLAELALGLPERLAAATGAHCVVAWDEFQELTKLPASRGGVLSLARAVWQKHRRTTYVVCGSERGLLTRLVTSERSPFFQHFELMELGPMSPTDAQALLRRSTPKGRAMPADVAALAVQVLGGHPFYLQTFGEQLTRHAPPWDVPLVRQVVSELLFTRTGPLSLYFAREFDRIVGSAATLAATLEAVATGADDAAATRPATGLRTNEVARRIGASSGAAVRYLERLGDVVVRDADLRWTLADPVFGLWLRWRRPGGTVVPMSVVGDEAERGVARALAELGFELVYQSRASRGAFDLLGVRAGAQVGVQVKRTTLPLRFTTAAWARLHADAGRLGWRALLAVVTPEGRVHFFDPAKARLGKQAALHADAALGNVLAWLG
ncbi:MAG: ATP-binding protein [Myxococcaceae bacterium]|nr:ATP-binding protein [Myxococcaceae bacterium]